MRIRPLLIALFMSTAISPSFAASVMGVEFGSHPSQVLERYPQGREIFNYIRIRLDGDRQLIAYHTKFNRIFKVRLTGRDHDCNTMIKKLLIKFPSTEEHLPNLNAVLAEHRKYYDWVSSNIEVNFDSCGPHKFNIHIIDNAELANEKLQLDDQEKRDRENSKNLAEEIIL